MATKNSYLFPFNTWMTEIYGGMSYWRPSSDWWRDLAVKGKNILKEAVTRRGERSEEQRRGQDKDEWSGTPDLSWTSHLPRRLGRREL